MLSEFAGAAQEMFDAFVVNPYDESAVASCIAECLEMNYEDRWIVTNNMRSFIMENDSTRWAAEVVRIFAVLL